MINSIFICGTGRCGTTIFADVLAQNPKVLNMGETHIFHEYEKFIQILRRRIIKGLVKNKYEQVEVFSAEYISDCFSLFLKDFAYNLLEQFRGLWGTDYVMDKTPHNLERIEQIIKVYPNPRFIHILRDPRDVYASMKKCSWGFPDVESFSAWYDNFMRYSLKRWKNIENKTLIFFEKLILNPENYFKSLFFPLNQFEYDFSIINENKAHFERFKFDLSFKEIKYIEKTCFTLYKQWRELA